MPHAGRYASQGAGGRVVDQRRHAVQVAFQALIDAGEEPGVKSYEVDRLAQARRRIKDLGDVPFGLASPSSAKSALAALTSFSSWGRRPHHRTQQVRHRHTCGAHDPVHHAAAPAAYGRP